MTHLGRITIRAACVALLLLFTLRAMAAPGLCAAHDAVAQSDSAATGVTTHGPALTLAALVDSATSHQKRAESTVKPMESGTDDYCDNPVIAGDCARAFSAAEPAHHDDTGHGLHCGLCWPEPEIVSAVVQLSLLRPLVAWSTLDMAPRLRI